MKTSIKWLMLSAFLSIAYFNMSSAKAASGNDAGITGIINPGTQCPGYTDIYVNLKNFGPLPLTGLTVEWMVNGQIQAPYIFSGSLATDSSIQLGIGIYDLSGGVNYTIKAWTESPNNLTDVNPLNDTSSISNVLTLLSGNYTVGGTGANFSSVTELVTALSQGICGPVNIDLDSAAGPYSRLSLGIIPGASDLSPVVIRGNGSLIVHNAVSASRSYIMLNGSDYVTIEGFRIEVPESATYGYGIQVLKGNYNTIRNNTVNIPFSKTTNAFMGIVFNGTASGTTASGGTFNYNRVENNRISGGYYSVLIYGTTNNPSSATGNIFRMNKISDTYMYAFTSYNTNGLVVEYNEISRPSRNVNIQNVYGIYTNTTTCNARINGNKLHSFFPAGYTGTSAAYALAANSNKAPVGQENIWSNNVVYNMHTNGTIYGIYNSGSDGQLYFYNSINLDGTHGGATGVYGVYQTSAALNLTFYNNSISVSRSGGTGQKRGFYFNAAGSTIISDYNNIYVPNGAVGQFTSTVYTTLNDWRTVQNFDTYSISGDPQYNHSLNLIPQSGSPLINGGAWLQEVTEDISGNLRTAMPYIGAYEFNGDYSGPVISYHPVKNILSAASPYILTDAVTITDAAGVSGEADKSPRIYYKLSTHLNTFGDNTAATNGWKYTESASMQSPYTFTVDFTKLFGGIPVTGAEIEYFFVAQDSLGFVSASKAIFPAPPDSINLTATSFPVNGMPDKFRISEAISGTMLVGTGYPYTSLSSAGGAFQHINESYLSGDITIVVKSNTTETGANALNKWLETGAGNYSVKIIPDSTQIVKTLSGSYAGGLIRLQGLDNFYIDGSTEGSGNYLKFQNTYSSDLSATLQLISTAAQPLSKNIRISNTTLLAGSKESTTFNAAVYIGGEEIKRDAMGYGYGFENIRIENNTIQFAQHGIYVTGSAADTNKNIYIAGNTIGSGISAQSVGYAGIFINYTKGAKITGNHINNIRTDVMYVMATNYYTPKGIIVSQGTEHSRISNNRISGVRSAGIVGFGASGIEFHFADNDTLDNNMISGIGDIGNNTNNKSDLISGIRIKSDVGTLKVYYNSVYLSGSTNSASPLSAALYIDSAAVTGGLDIRNNTFSTGLEHKENDSAKTYTWYSAVPAAAYLSFDYNNFYASSSQGVLAYVSGDINTLTELRMQSLANQNSMNIDPLHISDSNLHAQGMSLYGRGLPLPGIHKDIDGELRDATSPCIGADEFQPLANDIMLVKLLHPGEVLCGMLIDSIVAVVHNMGSSAQNAFGLTALLSGAVSDSIHFNYTGTLAPNQRDTITIGYYNSTSGMGELIVNAYLSSASDMVAANDSAFATALMYAIPDVPVVSETDVTVCKGSSVSLSASSNASIQWYDAPTGGVLLSDSSTLMLPAVYAPATYYVQAGTDTKQKDELGADTVGSASYGGYYTLYTNFQLAFSVNRTSSIDSVTVYAYGGSNGTIVLRILNSSNTAVIYTRNIAVNVPAGTPQRLRLPVEYTLQPGNYRIDLTGTSTSVQLYRQTGAAVFPYASSNEAVVITAQMVSNFAMPDFYYYLYEWSITTDRPGCASLRIPVTVKTSTPSGAAIEAMQPFNGIVRSGTSAEPDEVCAGDTLTYAVSPPDGFDLADYGITWNLVNASVHTLGGGTPSGLADMNGRAFSYIVLPADRDSVLVFKASVHDISTGCDSEIVRYVKVSGIVTFSLGADVTICSGSTVLLQPSAQGVSYLWSTGDTTRTLQANTEGRYILAVFNASGCASYDTILVHIAGIPLVSLGADTLLCAGSVITLDAGNSATSYLWSTGDTTQYLSVTTDGSYSVAVTNSLGCHASDTIRVTFESLVINLGEDKEVCANETLVLDAANPGASYLWNTGAVSQTISITEAGTYSVIVTSARGCIVTDSVTIQHKAIPDAIFTAFVIDSSEVQRVQFNVNVKPSQIYSWNFGDPSSPSNTSQLPNPVHVFTAAGTYTVTLSVTNVISGCSSVETQTIAIVVSGITNNEAKQFNLLASPNPFSGNTKITYTLDRASRVSLEIYDLLGRKLNTLLQPEEQQAGIYTYDFDAMNTKAQGRIYLIRLIVDDTSSVIRVLDLSETE